MVTRTVTRIIINNNWNIFNTFNKIYSNFFKNKQIRLTIGAVCDIITVYEVFWEGDMTKDTAKEEFCDTVVPVILGNGLSAHLLGFRLNTKKGLSSVLCGSRRNILDLLDLGCGYLSLSKERSRLSLEQLIDFADKWNECILVLIPLTDADRRFLEENREVLESRYLICEDKEMDALPIDSPERWV